MKFINTTRTRLAVVLLLVFAECPAYAATLAKEFDTPDAAVAALADAVRSNQSSRLRSILGPASDRLVHSGDKVEDADSRRKFVTAYDESHTIVY